GLALVVGIGAFALYPREVGTTIRSYALEGATSLPASLYFEAAHTALDHANLESLIAIARTLKSIPTPVVVAAYADPSGNRARNLRLAQKRAASVRDALVDAGVPTLRVVLVSPTVAVGSDVPRVEISLVRGVRAFPAQRRLDP